MNEIKKLWILEDDDGIVEMYRICFLEYGEGKYELSIFRSLRDFLSAAKTHQKNQPDLIISDLCLPDGNFSSVFVTAEMFKKTTGLRAPVMVASGWTDLEPIRRLLAAGAIDYLTKPFSPAELLAKAERHLIRSASELSFGDASLKIDPHTLTLTGTRGEAIELTSKQFQIVMLFLNNPGRSVARDEIVRRVWGNVNVSSKNMNVHISLLRQKIKAAGLSIHFVPPHNYMLEETDVSVGMAPAEVETSL